MGRNEGAVTLVSLKLGKWFLVASNEFLICICLHLPDLVLPHMANIFPSRAAHKALSSIMEREWAWSQINLTVNPRSSTC